MKLELEISITQTGDGVQASVAGVRQVSAAAAAAASALGGIGAASAGATAGVVDLGATIRGIAAAAAAPKTVTTALNSMIGSIRQTEAAMASAKAAALAEAEATVRASNMMLAAYDRVAAGAKAMQASMGPSLLNGIEAAGSSLRGFLATSIESAASAAMLAIKIIALGAAYKGISAIKDAVMGGIQFNSMLEQQKLSTQSLYATFSRMTDARGHDLNTLERYTAAQGIAVEMQERLKVAAIQTSLEYSDLVQIMSVATPFMLQKLPTSVISDSKKMMDLIAQFSQGAKIFSAGTMSTGEIGTNLMKALQGTANPRVARFAYALESDLGNSPKEIAKRVAELQKEGKFYDYLMGRVQAFGRAGKDAMTTYMGAVSNLHDAWEQLTGVATKEDTGILTQVVLDLQAALVTVDAQGKATFNPDIVSGVRLFADAFVDVAKAIATAISNLGRFIDFAKVLNEWAQSDPIGDYAKRGGASSSAAIQQDLDYKRQELKTGNNTDLEKQALKADIARLQAMVTSTQAKEMASGTKPFDFDARLGEVRQQRQQRELSAANRTDRNKRMQEEVERYGQVVSPDLIKSNVTIRSGKEEADAEALTKKQQAQKEAMDKQLAALREMSALREFDMKITGLQTKKLEEQTVLAQVERDIEREKTVSGGQVIDFRTRQLLLQHQITASSQDELDYQIAIAQAEKKREQELAKIEKEQTENGKRDKAFQLPDTVFKNQREQINSDALLTRKQLDAKHDQDVAATASKERQFQQGLYNEQLRIDRDVADKRIAYLDAQRPHYEQFFQGMADLLSNALSDAMSGGNVTASVKDLSALLRKQLIESLTGPGGPLQRWTKWMQSLSARAEGQDIKTYTYDLQGNKSVAMNPDGTPRLMTQPGDKKIQAGLMGLQGVSALYGLYQSGQQGASRTQNMISGASSGASLGALYGSGLASVYGAIIGAFVGAIAGYLTTKEKASYTVTISNGRITLAGGGSAKQADVNQAMASINKTIQDSTTGLHAIFDAFPIALGQSFKTFDPAGVWKNGARWFDPTTLKTFMQQDLPQMMLDAYTPAIQGGLTAMGVAQKKIGSLFSKANTLDPTAFMKFITDYIEQFTQLKDSLDFARKTIGEKTAIAQGLATPKLEDQLAKANEQIAYLGQGFADLTDADQVARLKQINDAIKSRYELEINALQEIATTQKAVAQSFSDIKSQRRFAEATPTGQLSQLQAQEAATAASLNDQFFRQNRKTVAGAKTPAEVRAIADAYAQLNTQIYDFAKNFRDQFKAVLDSFKALDLKKQADIDALLTPTDHLQKIADSSAKLNEGFGGLPLEQQLSRSQDLIRLANEYYDIQHQALMDLSNAAEALHRSIQEQIQGIAFDQLSKDPQAQVDSLLKEQRSLYDQLKTATTAAEIQDIVGRVQQNASKLYDLQGKTPEAAKSVTDMLTAIQTLADQRIAELKASWHANDDAMKQAMDSVVQHIGDTVIGLEDVMKKATADLAAFGVEIAKKLGTFTDTIIASDAVLLATLEPIFTALGSSVIDTTGQFKDLDDAIGKFGKDLGNVGIIVGKVATDPRWNYPSGDPIVPGGGRGNPLTTGGGDRNINITIDGNMSSLVTMVRGVVNDSMERSQQQAARFAVGGIL